MAEDRYIAAQDPGLKGAIVVLPLQRGSVPILLAPWPTLTLQKAGGGEKNVYDEPAVFRLLESTARLNVLFVLEKQQAMPGQGVTSMFSTGFGYGMLRGMLTALRCSWEEISPQAWQKAMFAGLPKTSTGKKAKKASATLAPLVCQRLFPLTNLLATPKSRVPHSGICDALLMAEYVRRRETHELKG